MIDTRIDKLRNIRRSMPGKANSIQLSIYSIYICCIYLEKKEDTKGRIQLRWNKDLASYKPLIFRPKLETRGGEYQFSTQKQGLNTSLFYPDRSDYTPTQRHQTISVPPLRCPSRSNNYSRRIKNIAKIANRYKTSNAYEDEVWKNNLSSITRQGVSFDLGMNREKDDEEAKKDGSRLRIWESIGQSKRSHNALVQANNSHQTDSKTEDIFSRIAVPPATPEPRELPSNKREDKDSDTIIPPSKPLAQYNPRNPRRPSSMIRQLRESNKHELVPLPQYKRQLNIKTREGTKSAIKSRISTPFNINIYTPSQVTPKEKIPSIPTMKYQKKYESVCSGGSTKISPMKTAEYSNFRDSNFRRQLQESTQIPRTFKSLVYHLQVLRNPISEAISIPSTQRKILSDKTLIIDLDLTLIFNPSDTPQHLLPPHPQRKRTLYGMEFFLRPNAIRFLLRMREYYEIILSTCSLREYAQPIIAILEDNDGGDKISLFDYKLYREHCLIEKIDGIRLCFKRKINRDKRNVVILDDDPKVWIHSLANLVPIRPFLGDSGDDSLMHIANYLIKIHHSRDVRIANKKHFGLVKGLLEAYQEFTTAGGDILPHLVAEK